MGGSGTRLESNNLGESGAMSIQFVEALLDLAAGPPPAGHQQRRQRHGVLIRWLPAFDCERKAANDWRILLLDSYRAHMGDDIRNLAWERGYIVLFLFGHITAVLQINDTDLHAAFKRIYENLECVRFTRKLIEDPQDISATRQEVLCMTEIIIL